MSKEITGQLLCTFFDYKYKDKVFNEIINTYVLVSDKVFLVKTDDNRYFFSYNVTRESALNNKIRRTLMVHRKKETNTLFTINSLNELQREINNGILDKTSNINWENYTNKILLITENELTKNDIKTLEVLTVKYIETKK
jgi:hypothetical protein